MPWKLWTGDLTGVIGTKVVINDFLELNPGDWVQFSNAAKYESSIFGDVYAIDVTIGRNMIDVSTFDRKAYIYGLSSASIHLVTGPPTQLVLDALNTGGRLSFDEIVGGLRYHGDVILTEMRVDLVDRVEICAVSSGAFTCEKADIGTLIRRRVAEIRSAL